jgi:HEPN domain-containing protein
MDNSYVEDVLDTAERAFQATRGQTSETGLEVNDEALVQLRKACRLLEAARTLRERNGYYTVVIEASFVAVERSIQSFLLQRGYTRPEELRHGHTEVYETAADVNLCSSEFAARLTQLWEQNRAEIYYRETPASAEQATAMLDLAEAVHQYVLEFGSMTHNCLCENTSSTN